MFFKILVDLSLYALRIVLVKHRTYIVKLNVPRFNLISSILRQGLFLNFEARCSYKKECTTGGGLVVMTT